MDPGQFQSQPQMHGLPKGRRYDESQVASSLLTEKLSTFDGLPRKQPAPQFINTWPSNIVSGNYSLAMPTAQGSTDWSCPSQKWTCSSYSATDLDDMSLANDLHYYSHYSSTFPGNLEDDTLSRSQAEVEGIPRTWQLSYDTGMSIQSSQAPGGYESSSYMTEGAGDGKEETGNFSTMGSGLDYDQHESSRDFARLSISRSPKIENDAAFAKAAPSRLSSSVGSDDGHSSREMTAVDFEDHGVDEPYAKLIYRALMSAPNHSMVLQEIYQWFRDNTAKGSSDTKGWMNSIRHNLSMNAAFKKTERKLSGDETKKSTEWVLEDFAVKDGVQSTTRYRNPKGGGSKKFIKSDNPTPARQFSGRKGGICGSKKSQRQKVRDDRTDMRRSAPRLDIGSQLHRDSRPGYSQRQNSPLTPPNVESISSSPYYFSSAIDGSFEMPYEDMCSLGDVQGIYMDDNTPLFSNSQAPFPTSNPNCASQY